MRILVIEDEPKIAQAVKQGLELKGFAVDTVQDADSGLSYGTDPSYDVIVLDRMLPGSMDGVELCRKLRDEGISTPVIMLTARGTIGDRVEGLDSGADDYLVKPFSFDELNARVRALLRRPPTQVGTELRVGDLSLNTNNYEVKRGQKSLKLSHKEFALLEYLMHHPGQVITKDMIINHVWDEDADILPNTVEVYIGYLRGKIDRPFPKQEPLIKTMRGFGYKLEA
ncbi:MAG TPA: response regulator transcription factor [Candidatus Saccharimonadales bacterium]|nr:response regulator transcription factor [Candidatus Saccharimonadales bacterium]